MKLCTMDTAMLEVVFYHVLAATCYALILIMLLRLTRPGYLAFRRRKSGYGVVFNSVTGKPEPRTVLSLQDLSGRTIRTAPTDADGRYNLVAPKGEYIIDVRKVGFVFPSKILNKKNNDTNYEHLLCTKRIFVTDHGSITKNIPIDPPSAERKTSILKRRVLRNRHLQDAIVFTTPLFAIIMFVALMRFWEVWVLFILYIMAIGYRFADFKPPPPPYGTVRDDQTNQPLDKVIVRIFDQKYGKVLETQITSEKGRYGFVVKPGSYRLLIQKKGFKTVIMNFPEVKQDHYLLAVEVRMKAHTEEQLPRNIPEEPAQQARIGMQKTPQPEPAPAREKIASQAPQAEMPDAATGNSSQINQYQSL